MPLIEFNYNENSKRNQALKKVLPSMSKEGSWCNRERNGWECTRKADHKGAHVGHLFGGEPCAAWGSAKQLLKLLGTVTHDA